MTSSFVQAEIVRIISVTAIKLVDEQKIGCLIGEKYHIDAYIGSGGMGNVYEATHLNLRRKVALKILKNFDVSHERSLSRFRREAMAAGLIGHDNVCEVTDFGQDQTGLPFLVMPLLSGVSFSELLRNETPLNGNRIVDVACQTLSALEAAHNKSIIHRDLKPSNLFITSMGDRNDFVKLLDFGISKFLDDDDMTKLTRTGLVPGTPFYMAPEQAEGRQDIDRRVDIYALGVILYEAFTGTLPFKGDSYNEIIFAVVTKPFKYPRAISPNIPECIEDVILKAMSRDPDLRFESASAMRQALLKIPKDILDHDFGSQNAPEITDGSTASTVNILEEDNTKNPAKLEGSRLTLFFLLFLALVTFVFIICGSLGPIFLSAK